METLVTHEVERGRKFHILQRTGTLEYHIVEGSETFGERHTFDILIVAEDGRTDCDNLVAVDRQFFLSVGWRTYHNFFRPRVVEHSLQRAVGGIAFGNGNVAERCVHLGLAGEGTHLAAVADGFKSGGEADSLDIGVEGHRGGSLEFLHPFGKNHIGSPDARRVENQHGAVAGIHNAIH